MEHAIVIPALNPDKKMLVLVDELTKMGAGRIIVVDDGSADASKKVFRQLRSRENVVLLRHLVNKGKGAALKTAFSYCFEHLRDTVSGVITADCDGQHTPRDIFRISEALAAAPDCLILGVRDFAGAAVPRRSLMGNRVTSRFFSLMYHVYLPDTQTGLRGIPASELEWMTKLTGQKYDYEINMLIQAKRRKIGFRQIGIEVVYFDNNQNSHFKTVPDTARIAKTLAFNFFLRSYERERFYGRLFYFTRSIMRRFNRKLRVVGDVPQAPAVYIGHHQNMAGVLGVMMWVKFPVHIWALSCFHDEKESARQFGEYTFTERHGWNKTFSAVCARLAGGYVAKLVRAARAVPVYRNSVRGLKATFNQSVDILCRDENLLIFPDVDYAGESADTGEIYTGFVALDRYYFAETGKHVNFVPIKVRLDAGEIRIGRPIRVADGEDFAAGKERVCKEIRERLNGM